MYSILHHIALMYSILHHIALMYSPLESTLGHYRGVDDNINSIAAATITGLVYKSTGK